MSQDIPATWGWFEVPCHGSHVGKSQRGLSMDEQGWERMKFMLEEGLSSISLARPSGGRLTALCSFKCTTSHPGPGAWPSAPGLPPSPSFPVLQIRAPNRETEGEGEAWGVSETCHGLRLAGSKIGI